MAQPTWGMLAKSQTDPKTIEERIAEMIAEHNNDEEAHLGPGQSLQSHKASEIIDHLASSIVNDKLEYIIRSYNAVVASSGGDYDNIQDAIDYVSSQGGGNILIAPGTFTLSADLILKNNVSLYGSGEKFSFINCNGHRIVTSCSLDESDPNWEEETLNVTFKDLGVYGGADEMVYAQGSIQFIDCLFYGVVGTLVTDLGGGNRFINCSFSQTSAWFNSYKNYDYYGIKGTDGVSSYIANCSFDNMAKAISVGEKAIVTCNKIHTCKYGIIINYPGSVINGNNIVNAKGYGVHIDANLAIVSANFIMGDENFGQYASGDGVYVNGGDNCIITSNRVYSFQYGVRLAAYSDRNLVVANILTSNAAGATINAGTNNLLQNNITS